jgi:hypothetical protein
VATDEQMDEIQTLFDRTNKENPSKEDVKALRSALARSPDAWRKAGDLAVQNELTMLSEIQATKGAREMIKAALNAMRRDLGYAKAPMLEQMLIEAVLLAWLRLNLWEYELTGLHAEGMSFEKAAFWEKRISAAQRRYLRACETLARVRKITRSTLQINIAEPGSQQVNIAGDYVKGESTDQRE